MDDRMPKMKTHSGAKKRFKITANGKVRARHAGKTHILQKKSAKRRRYMDEPLILKPQDAKRVKDLLGK
jgi:large subunit ribosomal protein L35